MASDRERLLQLLAARSVLTGAFTLSSGQTSNVYVDARLTTTAAAAMPLIGRLFLELFREHGWWKPDAVIGPTLGADPILGAISYASAVAGDPVDHIIVRKEPKGYGSGSWLAGRTEGVERVILVEDVWTTGGSSKKALDAAAACGLEVYAATALVDREQGAREAFAPLPTAALFRLTDVLAAAGL